MKTPVTDKARLMLAPVKHILDWVSPQVGDLLRDIEALEATIENWKVDAENRRWFPHD